MNLRSHAARRSAALSSLSAFWLGLVLADAATGAPTRAEEGASGPWKVPVVVVEYYPVAGEFVDKDITGDWGESLEFTQQKVREATAETLRSLEEGSRYHAYSRPEALPSLDYEILATHQYMEPLPTFVHPGHQAPMTDYQKILARIDARTWVEERGVKEFWIWAYHGGKVDLWESNLSSPWGDVSNSDRATDDLPVFDRSYTVYHYNYQRSSHEAVHNHFHQIEHLLNWVDGRDGTPGDQWQQLLFWGRFVGSDESHKIVRPGAGWCHYPPNAEQDYDYANPRKVSTDIEDWKPDGSGARKDIGSDRWEQNDLLFYVYWFQNLPGMDNGLSIESAPLHNWWMVVGDWDRCMRERLSLVQGRPGPPPPHDPEDDSSAGGK